MRKHLGVWGQRPQRESRGQRPLVLAAKARVQGRALPPAEQAAPPARSACRKGTGAGQSPAARRAGGPSGEECLPQRHGCRAEPCRPPRRRPLRRGVLAAQAGVEFSKKGFTNALLYGMMLSAFECSQRNPLLRPLGTGRVQHAASPARNAAFGRFNYSLL